MCVSLSTTALNILSLNLFKLVLTCSAMHFKGQNDSYFSDKQTTHLKIAKNDIFPNPYHYSKNVKTYKIIKNNTKEKIKHSKILQHITILMMIKVLTGNFAIKTRNAIPFYFMQMQKNQNYKILQYSDFCSM